MALGLGSMMPFLKPVSDWVEPRRNAMLGFSAGMFEGDPGAAMRYAMQGRGMDQQYALEAQERAQQEAERNATMEWVKQNAPQFATLPPAMAFEAAMKQMAQAQSGAANTPASVQEFQFARDNGFTGTFEEWRKGGNQTVRAGLGQPVVLINRETQERTPFMPMSDGTYVNPLTGTAADESWMFDPAALVADKTGAAEDAKTAAAARAALPSAQTQRDVALRAVDKIIGNDAGINEWFGQIGPRGIYVNPGSPMGNFVSDFAQAQGQSFLQARQFLKGQGAITEQESGRAEAAYSNMEAAMKTGDKQRFIEAADEFKRAVEDGYRKLETLAGGGYAAPTQSTPANSGANTTSSGVSWKVK